MKNNGAGDKELLVAGSNKECRKICRRMWYMLEDEELYGSTGGETDGEWGTRKTVNTLDGWLHNKVAISS